MLSELGKNIECKLKKRLWWVCKIKECVYVWEVLVV